MLLSVVINFIFITFTETFVALLSIDFLSFPFACDRSIDSFMCFVSSWKMFRFFFKKFSGVNTVLNVTSLKH